MLGSHVDVPFYVSATALCKLGNPLEGEKDVARGCGQGVTKVPQMISTLASCSPEEIIEAAPLINKFNGTNYMLTLIERSLMIWLKM